MARLVLIAGESGSGKSTWCAAQASQARASGRPIAGLLSPAVFEEGAKVAIDLVDLASGTRRRLARLRSPEERPDPATPRWQFDGETLAWGDAVLARLLHRAEAPDALFVDELGPLELVHGRGWQQGLALLDQGSYRVAYVAIRPGLVADALARWPQAEVLQPHAWPATGL